MTQVTMEAMRAMFGTTLAPVTQRVERLETTITAHDTRLTNIESRLEEILPPGGASSKFIPTLVAIKGICEYSERRTNVMNQTQAEDLVNKLKASISAATVGFAKFMEGKVSQATVSTYAHQVKRCLVLQSRSFRAAASEAYRLLVQRTAADVRSNRATSCGLSWFSRFHAAVCEEHGGAFQVEAAWEEEANRERKKKEVTVFDEAGMEIRSGGKGSHSSKYVGVSWNSRLKKWLAFSKDSKGGRGPSGFGRELSGAGSVGGTAAAPSAGVGAGVQKGLWKPRSVRSAGRK
ncbi:unnamed protein product [Prorocentrum cordatum]|uniref:Uncharacterized protein n=1 Tax=Prorocentrum cordatum TaxID=2364126 RepID=A0ABN9RAG4_9DINO|nr:unnamed protein product [Polarella glacialis]